MSKKKKEFDFSKTIIKIENIVEKVTENDNIEKAIIQCKEGLEMIDECKKYIKKQKNEIKVIKK